MPFAGELSLDEEGQPLRAEIDFTATELVVSTAAGPVGRWPMDHCRIEADNGRFRVSIADERAWFVPDDALAFTHQVLDRWEAVTLASAVKAARAATAPHPPEISSELMPSEADGQSLVELVSSWSPRRRMQLAGAGLLVMVVVVLASVSVGGGSPPATLGTIPPSTTTTVFPVVFTSGLGEVTALWNEAAQELGVNLFLSEVVTGRRLQVPLPDDLVLYGTEEPVSGRVRTLMLSAGPGLGGHGQVVLAAWGVLIAVANPELDPDERRALLERLGVDVNRPLTIGMKTETVQGAARYWLVSGVLGDRVLFGVQPESSSQLQDGS